MQNANERDQLARQLFLSRNGGGSWVGEFEDTFDFTAAMEEADFVVASGWLRTHDSHLKAEALEAAADDLDVNFQDLPSWSESYKVGERSDDWMRGSTRMVGDAIKRLLARADEYREQADQ